MRNLLNITFLSLFIFGCNEGLKKDKKKPDFKNKEEYISEKLKLNKKTYLIKKGEEFKIYYTNNSCCLFCPPRLKDLNKIKFIKDKVELNSDEECCGCSSLSSLTFIGIEKGIDTIFTTKISPLKKCDSINDENNFEKYIIIVK